MTALQQGSSPPGRRSAGVWPFPLDYILFYGLLAIFGIQSFFVSLIAACLYPLLPRRAGGPLGQFLIMAGFRQFLKLMELAGILRCDLDVLDQLGQEGPLIIVANHPSLLDAVLVISRLRRVICIMKAEIWNNWFLGGGARLAGYIRNDSPHDMIRLSVVSLKQPQQLLIFPEGTRTSGAGLNPFKHGFGLIAKHAAVPVQTVFIETNTRFLGKGWPLFKKPDFPLMYRIRLGERRHAGEEVKQFVVELQQYFQQEYASAQSRSQAPPR